MKKRSEMAAIILSLCLAGSARAGVDNWIVGAFAVTNVAPYVGAAVNTATNLGNLYLNYRNGLKIDAVHRIVNEVGESVNQVGQKVDNVDKNVGKLGKGLDRTNLFMNALHQDTKIGFKNINAQLAQNAQTLNIVHRDLNNLRVEQQTNMEILTAQNERMNTKLDLMKTGILGLHDRVANLENKVSTDMKSLNTQNIEIQSSLQSLNTRVEDFAQFAQTGMHQLATIQAMLEQLVGKDQLNKAIVKE